MVEEIKLCTWLSMNSSLYFLSYLVPIFTAFILCRRFVNERAKRVEFEKKEKKRKMRQKVVNISFNGNNSKYHTFMI